MAAVPRFPQVQPPARHGELREPGVPSGKTDGLPLGRLLVRSGAVTVAAVAAALATQRRTFLPLGRILRDEHGLGAEALADALRQQNHVPRVFLRFFPIEAETVKLLDRRLCLEHEVLPFERLGDLLCVAFSNPAARGLVLRLRLETGFEVVPFQAPWEDIQRKLKLYP